MGTLYQPIHDKFIKKLKNDDSFFNYKDLTDAEIVEQVKDHLDSLLDLAVSFIYKYGNPDINFYDKNDDAQTFVPTLVNQEIDLLRDLMYFSYVEQDRNIVKAMGTSYTSSELKEFSPANERNSYLKMLEKLESTCINSVENYIARDRLTWNYKSIYEGSS